MGRRPLIALLGLPLLVDCTTEYHSNKWTKANLSTIEFQNDRKYCDDIAYRQAIADPNFGALMQPTYFRNCMMQLGYREVGEEEATTGVCPARCQTHTVPVECVSTSEGEKDR
jgi:hypothetical protein